MSTKVYQTTKPQLSLSYAFKDELGNVKEKPLFFTGGLLSTDDEAVQKFIESLPTFKEEVIWEKTLQHDLDAAKLVAAKARKVAQDAAAVADAADAAVKALTPTEAKSE